VQTLHYYERLGLLPKPHRSTANYRLYSSDAIRRVKFIRKAKAIGLTLEETKQISPFERTRSRSLRQGRRARRKTLAGNLICVLLSWRQYRRALADALGDWQKENTTERECAG
jgi:DNA-binding transcriptional MerR regulator